MRILLALLACLSPEACVDADGSRPRSSAPATSAGFNGGYAGTNYGFSNLDTRSAPF